MITLPEAVQYLCAVCIGLVWEQGIVSIPVHPWSTSAFSSQTRWFSPQATKPTFCPRSTRVIRNIPTYGWSLIYGYNGLRLQKSGHMCTVAKYVCLQATRHYFPYRAHHISRNYTGLSQSLPSSVCHPCHFSLSSSTLLLLIPSSSLFLSFSLIYFCSLHLSTLTWVKKKPFKATLHVI